MFIAALVILLTAAAWLFAISFMVNTPNWRSMFFFKFSPFVLGLAFLFLAIVQLGWLTI